MDPAARREAILAKKEKLAELKRTRALRQQELQNSRQASGEHADLIQPTPNRAARQRDIDDILTSVLGESRSSSVGPRETASPRGGSRSRPGSVVSSRPFSDDRLVSTPRLSSGSDEPQSQAGASVQSESTYVASGTQTLSVAPLHTVYEDPGDAAPAPEIVTYSKAVQTVDDWEPQRRHNEPDSDDEDWLGDGRSPRRRRQKDRLEQIRQELRKEIEEEVKSAVKPADEAAADAKQLERFPARTLSTDELEAVSGSRDFQDFIDQSTKVIERALDEQYDLLIDYTQGKGDLDEDDEGYGAGRVKKGRRVKEVAQYWDERWSKKRMISDLGFSPKYPELLLAAYTKNPSAPHDPSGLLQIWNAHMPSRPEYTFHASSDILTAKFSPFHPSIIVGGCYSGQVLLWDTRSKSTAPVQKTPLTGAGHTHPIYSLDIVGTQNANNIISCSTDGVVCSWSIDMLAQPQEYLELLAPSPSKTEDIAPLCIAFPQADPTYFLAGTEEGTVYACHRYERAGAKAGVDARVRYTGHAAPVMSLDFHPARGPVDLGDLVLSASMDWSVKLWRVRPPAALGTAVTGGNSVQGPVMEFPREDLVFDAKWSPVRPGVFAAVDGAGTLEVWDVNVDIEVPVASVKPSERAGGSAAWLKRSLNRCAWERNEGKKIAVGGLDGVVTVFEVGSELGGTETSKVEEWTQVKKVIGRAEAQIGARAAVNGRSGL
ncbi:WD40 repeat-like protein [Trichodelitschia bisporula]|uniref:WD40 repeat-like protein n=1 Tax=Trichodelitschia bisporula TaxID=703511 RepID=A0A6G1HXC3_9PEZI|nr:WD40 repeat-like protein [Trichodelitschia bisporula]